MKPLLILPLSLATIALITTGCNQSQATNQTTIAVAAETSSKQKPNLASTTVTPTSKENSKPTSEVLKEKSSKKSAVVQPPKSAKMIGHLIDCDSDGLQDDARMDYNGDDIPDECVIGNENFQVKTDESDEANEEDNIEPATDESFYQSEVNSLEELTKGCEESKKTEGSVNYSVCQLDGKPVQAAEAHVELGDGVGFWFENGKVKALRYFHSGELFFFEDGKLVRMYYDDAKTGKTTMKTTFDEKERNSIEETARNGYGDIFQNFDIR